MSLDSCPLAQQHDLIEATQDMADHRHNSAHPLLFNLPTELLMIILENMVNVCKSSNLLTVSKSFKEKVHPIVYKVHGEAALQHVITNKDELEGTNLLELIIKGINPSTENEQTRRRLQVGLFLAARLGKINLVNRLLTTFRFLDPGTRCIHCSGPSGIYFIYENDEPHKIEFGGVSGAQVETGYCQSPSEIAAAMNHKEVVELLGRRASIMSTTQNGDNQL